MIFNWENVWVKELLGKSFQLDIKSQTWW